MKTNYQGNRFSVLGDSLSALKGYCPPENEVFYDYDKMLMAEIYSPSDMWWGKVIDALGGKLLVNESFSGSVVVKHPACEIESYGCSDKRTGNLSKDGRSPDVIMVYLGSNDWGCGIRVMPERNEESLAVFFNAYSAMLAKLGANYPDAEIWCMTLMESFCSRDPQFVFPYRPGGWHIREYNEAIRLCGANAGCRVIDLAKAEPYDTIDGFHPNAGGMETIARAVLHGLEETE